MRSPLNRPSAFRPLRTISPEAYGLRLPIRGASALTADVPLRVHFFLIHSDVEPILLLRIVARYRLRF